MAPLEFAEPGTNPTHEADDRQLVERYVRQLKADGAIRSPAVERAFLRVERTACCRPFTGHPAPGAAHQSATTPSIRLPSTSS